MVKVNNVYYDGYLLGNLRILKKNIKDDWDFWLIIDGLEGSGKSTLGQQCGFYLDPRMTINNIVFTPKQFEKAVDTLPKYSVVIWDEAITGTQSTDMTKIARTLQKKAVQMRQKNLYVILILHSYFEMKKYYAIHRTWFLLHTYYRPNMKSEKFERGYFSFYGRDAKRLMYCNDQLRRNYNYGYKPEFRGRFTKKYTVDEELYKEKKAHVGDEDEGLSDKEFAEESFKRGMTVNNILPFVTVTERYLYKIKKNMYA